MAMSCVDSTPQRWDPSATQNQSTPANNPQPASSSPAPLPNHSPPRSSSNKDTNNIERSLRSLHSRPVVSDGQILRGILCGSCVGMASTLKNVLRSPPLPLLLSIFHQLMLLAHPKHNPKARSTSSTISHHTSNSANS
jgi:hypothetical protein